MKLYDTGVYLHNGKEIIPAAEAQLLKIPYRSIQPDRISQIQLITDLLQTVKNLVRPSLLAVITDHGILQHMVIFPDSSPKAKHLRTPPIISVLVDSTLSLI